MKQSASGDFVYTTMPSPIGELTLVASDRGLAAIHFPRHAEQRLVTPSAAPSAPVEGQAHHPVLREARRQLDEYFAGKRKRFDLPLDFVGTDFQKRVWNELLKIPFGETRTYGEIAERLGNKNAMRAVGAANGQNPIPIVAPCHRVIGASGALVGFGGGLETKARLLDHERGALTFDLQS